MPGINKVILVGHIGNDPFYRIFENRVPVLSFSLATTEYHNSDGNRLEHTEWHNIIMWRAHATAAKDILRKHLLVYLEGKAHTKRFVDPEGVKRYSTEVVVSSFQVLSTV